MFMYTYMSTPTVTSDSSIIYGFGYIYEAPRATDYMYKASSTNATAGAFPANFSLRGQISGILNQGSIGSCVSNAIAQYIKMVSGTTWISRLFHYYVTRLMQGDTIVGSNGLSVERSMQCIKRYGVCDEGVWTYDTSDARDAKANQMPDINAFRESYKNIPIHLRDFKYEYLPLSNNRDTLNVVKDWLNKTNRPLLMAMGIDMNGRFDLKKYLRKPTSYQNLSGHMIVLIGYDDNMIVAAGDVDGPGYVTLANSWGYYFGDNGTLCISYDYLCDQKLVPCILGLTFTW